MYVYGNNYCEERTKEILLIVSKELFGTYYRLLFVYSPAA